MSHSSNDSAYDYSGDREPSAFHGDAASSASGSGSSPEMISVREIVVDAEPLNAIPPAGDDSDDGASSLREMLSKIGRAYRVRPGHQAAPSFRGVAPSQFPSLRDEEEGGEDDEGDNQEQGDDLDEEGDHRVGPEEEGGDQDVGEEEEEGGDEEMTLLESAPAKKNKPKRKGKDIVVDAVNIAMDGEVNQTPCKLKLAAFTKIYKMNGPLTESVWRMPREKEVACSDMTPEVCLSEFMFKWGLRITDGEGSPAFQHLVSVLNYYGLSPRQLSANSFLKVMAF